MPHRVRFASVRRIDSMRSAPGTGWLQLLLALALGVPRAGAAETNRPRLEIAPASNALTLRWPSWAGFFQPWSATSLTPPITWLAVSNSSVVTNARYSMSIAQSNRAGYFRLVESQPTLAAGLVAHFTFDEVCTNAAPGCVLDSSGRGNHGTLGGATNGNLPQAPVWTPLGKFGGAYLYDGRLEPGIPAPTTIGPGIYLPPGVDVDGNWTLSVWARLNNVTNNVSGTIYSQKRSSEDCRNLLIHWEGDLDQTMTLQVRDSACRELMLHNHPTNAMVAGRWYHLVGVGTNKTFSFYIDGVLQQSQHVGNMGALASDSHTVGMMFDNFGSAYNHYLDGSIDELRIYNRALSAAEILALFNQRGGSFP